MRELAITLRSKGYILSVDVPVPSEWTDYYQRDVLYQLCDFVIVMAYDEHYDGSEVAGSVSSKRFVIDAIYNMMQEGVAADKLILGVPFYTRVWMGVEDLRSEAVSSSRGWGCVYDYGLEVKYDEQTGQNYAEGMVGETLYRIWLEDGTSMKWRLQLVNDNDLAGVAAWSLGYDNYELWLEYEEAFFS
jgi:spore germination protein YaaH